MPHKYRIETDKGNFEIEVATPLETANTTPLHEPTTYAGGFAKSIGDTASKVGQGFISRFKQMSPLTPQPTMDEATKRLDAELAQPRQPFDLGKMISGIKSGMVDDPAARGGNLADLTAMLGGSMLGRVPLRSVAAGALRGGADFIEHPAITGAKVMRGAADLIGRGENDTPPGINRYAPNLSSDGGGDYAPWAGDIPIPPKQSSSLSPRVAGPAPKLEDVLHEALSNARLGDDTKLVSGQPAQGMTATGRPGITGSQYDEIQANSGSRGSSSPVGTGSPHPEGRSGDPAVIEEAPNGHTASPGMPDYMNQELGQWHSGAAPGSDEALGASTLHRDDASLLERLKHIMESKNDFAGGR